MASGINLSGLKDEATITLESKALEVLGDDIGDVVVDVHNLLVRYKKTYTGENYKRLLYCFVVSLIISVVIG